MEDVNMMRWTIASIALFLILGSLALIAKRIGPIQMNTSIKTKRRIKLKESLHLDGRNKVCLIEVDGEEKLLGVGQNSISLLQEKSTNAKTEKSGTADA